MTINTGYTYEITEAERQANEIATLRDMLTENPLNEWAFDRLMELQTKKEIARDNAWLDTGVIVKSNPALIGGIRYSKDADAIASGLEMGIYSKAIVHNGTAGCRTKLYDGSSIQLMLKGGPGRDKS